MIAACLIGFVLGAATQDLESSTLPNKMIMVQNEKIGNRVSICIGDDCSSYSRGCCHDIQCDHDVVRRGF